MFKTLLAYCILFASVNCTAASPEDLQVVRDRHAVQTPAVEGEAFERRKALRAALGAPRQVTGTPQKEQEADRRLSPTERVQLRDQLRKQALQGR